jgi:hypothetical protein
MFHSIIPVTSNLFSAWYKAVPAYTWGMDAGLAEVYGKALGTRSCISVWHMSAMKALQFYDSKAFEGVIVSPVNTPCDTVTCILSSLSHFGYTIPVLLPSALIHWMRYNTDISEATPESSYRYYCCLLLPHHLTNFVS